MQCKVGWNRFKPRQILLCKLWSTPRRTGCTAVLHCKVTVDEFSWSWKISHESEQFYLSTVWEKKKARKNNMREKSCRQCTFPAKFWCGFWEKGSNPGKMPVITHNTAEPAENFWTSICPCIALASVCYDLKRLVYHPPFYHVFN